MVKVFVIGAGAQGGPCTSILAGEERVNEIRLGDLNLGTAQKVASKIGNPKIKALQLDASNLDDVVATAAGVDVILNFTLIKFNTIIMKAALAVNAHYVDTACSGEFLDDWIARDEPELHADFVKVGKTALVGCGFAPGVANILTRFACDQMDEVEKIIIRAGRGYGGRSEDVVSAWKPTWSPEILLEDYADPPLILKDGKFERVPIFANPETYTFPEPLGDVLLSSHMHEEPYLIPKFYLGKGLKHLDFKYPVDKTVGAFIKMGFANDEPIDVNGVEVVPRDVLMKLVQRPANTFLSENETTILQSELTGIMDVSVEGVRDGKSVTHIISYRFTDGPNKAWQRQLFNAYGTTMLHVALPTMVGANMCLNGKVGFGVISPDSLDPKMFFKGMADRGVPFNFDEKVIKRTSIH
ncbi:saccharopine dehydrogenase family protein [Chloroflexota bacterium]